MVLVSCHLLANNKAMAVDSGDVVMCEACKKRVAEVIAEDGRALCSLCHLEQAGIPMLDEDHSSNQAEQEER